MIDFFKNIFSGSKAILGVDIGTTSVKIVELSGSTAHPKLSNYALIETVGHFERANSVIQANSLKISERETTALLKIALQKASFSTSYAIASIPSFASFLTLLEMPEMSEEETGKAMGFQIKQHIPLPLADITVDWIRVGQREDENGFSKQQMLLVAIPNDIISRYRAIFKGAGLRLKALEVENLAYTRAVIGNDATPSLIVDIGARSTNISVVDQGFLKHNAQIDYAGDSLTFAIAKGLSIGHRRAEELKKQRGIIGSMGEYELSTLELPFVDVIINEVRKVKSNVQNNAGISVQRVLLVGGGANLLGLEKYVEAQLGMPVALGNGLLYIDAPPSLGVMAKELQTRFAASIGLAIKNFIS